MNIENIKQSTINKINNNVFDFTNDEITILDTDTNIFLMYLSKICKDEKLFNDNFELALSILENIDSENNDIIEEIYNYISIFEEKYYYNQLKQKNIVIEAANLISSEEYLNEVIKTLKERDDYERIILNGDKYANGEAVIKILLDRKEYYVLGKIINYFEQCFADTDLFTRFLNEFPFNDYNVFVTKLSITAFADNKLKDILYNNLDKLNYSNLRDVFLRESDEDKQKIITDVMLKKINNKDENLNFFNPILNIKKNDLKMSRSADFNVEKSIINPVISSAFNQDITLNNLSIVLNYDIRLTDEQIDLLCKLIRESDIYLSLNNIYIIDNDNVINALIDSGNYDNLYYYIQENKKEYFDNVVYNAYKNNNTKVLSKTKLNLCYKLHSDLIKKFIKEKYVDLIDFKLERNEFNSSKNFDALFPDIMDYLLNASLDELKDNRLIMKIQSFPFIYIETLIKNKQYDKISLIPFTPYESDLKNKKELYVDLIKNSFSNASRLIKYYVDSILSEEEYRNAFLTYKFDYFNEKVLTFLQHAENDSLYNETLYNSVRDILIDKYNLNENHLDSMINKYGYLLIKYIDNDSIIKIINLDDNKFNKMIDLFNVEPYKMNDLEALYDSFKQEEFTLKYPEIKSIFPNIMHSLDNGTKDYFSYLDNLCEVWNKTLIDKILQEYPDEERAIQNNPDYIIYIGNIITSNDAITKERYTNILHIITDYYIAQKREQYRKTYDIYKEASIPFEYDKKDLDKIVTARTLQECIIYNQVSDYYNSELYRKIVNDLIEKGLSESEAKDSILLTAQKKFITRIERNQYFFFDILTQKYGEFLANSIIEEYKNKIDELNSNSDLKKNIGLVNKITLPYLDSYVYATNSLNGTNLDDLDIEDVKKKYHLEDSKINIFEILSNIRIDLLSDNTLDNDEIYDTLKRIIKKYKLDNLSPQVDNIVSNEIYDLSCNTTDISTFISFFHSIYEAEKAKVEVQDKSSDNLSISIMNIFKYLDKYASVSSIYSQILGIEDEGLVRSDPKPNNSTGMTKEERLKKAVDKTFKNFERNVVKIPTFNHNIELSNGKLITAIVGNFTKPTNITHGERTGACMRIGGAGYTLFNSDDIFHIEFNEPNTGKYISRVTGFRNGNTVFLNELRFSCDKELYSNKEVVEACKIVAQELLDRSKDSEFPIENVVIHRDYAMNSTEDNRVVLNISDNKKGLKHFYSDVGNYVQVLATNAEEGFVPVDLDNSKVPNYLPSREKIRSGSSQAIVEQINRLYTISLGLKGKPYYVNPIATDIVYGYVGEDWYVFINEQNEIICDRIDRDERSIIEYEFAKEEIKKQLNTMSKEENGYAI